ncbi:MAG: hypothetical protein AB7U43_05100 [Desulfobacter sp.]
MTNQKSLLARMLSASAAYFYVTDKGKRNTPPRQVPCPDTNPFTSLASGVFRPQAGKTLRKTDKAPYCSQRQSDYVHPKMHNQAGQ